MENNKIRFKCKDLFKIPLVYLFIFMIFASGVMGVIGRSLCMVDTQDYENLQPELTAPDEIKTVLHHEPLGMIYVCYNDASYVNAYTENGEFLWAVSTPYLRNAYFEIHPEELVIYGNDNAYIYNAQSGAFIRKIPSNSLDLSYDWENESTGEFQAGEIYFSTYQVYRADADGNLTTIVSRPWWHWIFNFGLCWMVGFGGFAGVGILLFLEQRKAYKKVVEQQTAEAPTKVRIKTLFTNRKARVMTAYCRVNAAVHLVYAALNVVFGLWFGGILCIGIIPLALHFIVVNVIFANMSDRLSIPEEERTVFDHWYMIGWGSFIIAFLSVIVAVAVAV
ncbi:MAG: hypothetical protein E7645_00405 [Ruminococcaceae bacterium]|nr:hypothetical protein [Oscillospiraceae bacterium]